jgi:hypothetical protein
MFEGLNKNPLKIDKIRSLDLRPEEGKAEAERVQGIAKSNQENADGITDEFSKLNPASIVIELSEIDTDEAANLGHSAEEISRRCDDVSKYFYSMSRKIANINSDIARGATGVAKEATEQIEQVTPGLLTKMEDIRELFRSYAENSKRLARKKEFVDGLFAVNVEKLDA